MVRSIPVGARNLASFGIGMWPNVAWHITHPSVVKHGNGKPHHLWMIFPLKPPFEGVFLMPRPLYQLTAHAQVGQEPCTAHAQVGQEPCWKKRSHPAAFAVLPSLASTLDTPSTKVATVLVCHGSMDVLGAICVNQPTCKGSWWLYPIENLFTPSLTCLSTKKPESFSPPFIFPSESSHPRPHPPFLHNLLQAFLEDLQLRVQLLRLLRLDL